MRPCLLQVAAEAPACVACSCMASQPEPVLVSAEAYNVIDEYAVKLPSSSPFLSLPSRQDWVLHGQSNDSFGAGDA